MVDVESRAEPQKRQWREVVYFFLFLIAGLSSWLLVNSLFVEMGYFISSQPEGESIATDMSLLIQISNFVPLLYVLLSRFFKTNYKLLITLLMVFGIVLSIITAMFWNVTVEIGSSMYSIPLLAISFCAGLIGTTSVVLFYPFASLFSPVYTSAISLGMGLTGALSSTLSTLQFVLKFEVDVFFFLNAVMISISTIAFLIIVFKSKDIMLQREQESEDDPQKEKILPNFAEEEEIVKTEKDKKNSSNYYAALLISNQFIICLIFYFLQVSIPYAVQNFTSNITTYIYTGSIFIGSVGRFFCIFSKFRFTSPFFIVTTTLVQLVVGIYLAIQCIMGYQLRNESIAWIVANTYILLAFMNGYEDTLLYQVAAITQVGSKRIEKITRFIGLANQAGAFVGSILSLIFIETNVLR